MHPVTISVLLNKHMSLSHKDDDSCAYLLTTAVTSLTMMRPKCRSSYDQCWSWVGMCCNDVPLLFFELQHFLFQNAPFQAKISNQKYCCQVQIFELKIHLNAFAARASPWTPLRELTALPQAPYVVFRGPLRGKRGEEGRRDEGRRGRWGGVPLLLFYSLTTGYDTEVGK